MTLPQIVSSRVLMRAGLGLIALALPVGCSLNDSVPRPDMSASHPTPPDLANVTAPPADLAQVITPPPADMSAMVVTPTDMAAPQQGPAPFVVDDHFVNSGFEGGGAPAGMITDDQTCPMRGGDGRGHCHHIDWKPGTNSWGAVVWQFPANNWGAMTGFAIPAGYSQVRFWAWGKTGGESVAFITGLDPNSADKFQQRVEGVKLTTTPKLYTLGVHGSYGDHVISAFGWATGANAAQTFYIDDIVWTGDSEGDATAPPSFAVDTKFGPSGYFGDTVNPNFFSAAKCTSPNGDSTCHSYDWNPNSDAGGKAQGYAGIIWQSAPGNWGGVSDPPGATIAAGYREVSFWAWSSGGGGEHVQFLVGVSPSSHDGFQSKLDVFLKTTPTLYTIGVAGDYGSAVVGGFGWSTNNTGGVRFNIDGAVWR